MSTTAEKIAVMQAFEQGHSIECRQIIYHSFDGEVSQIQIAWSECKEPSWEWGSWEYRAKPRDAQEVWLLIYDKFDSPQKGPPGADDKPLIYGDIKLPNMSAGRGMSWRKFREVTE